MQEDLLALESYFQNSPSCRDLARVSRLCEIEYLNKKFPLMVFDIGSQKPTVPTLLITGGIHGLERIGAELALSLLKTTADRLSWDQSLITLLKNIRLIIIPLVNPAGYYYFKRSNGNNVDLMRNSPVEAVEKVPFLLGGHRISDKLPWFRGSAEKMEEEIHALSNYFFSNCIQSECVISVDFHSGFGMRDRLWFPFSFSSRPFSLLAEMNALFTIFDQAHPYHVYKIEPQSKGYLLNGDLWDYLFLESVKVNPQLKFIPLTLEMGSWSWVRKNPLQLFSRHGIFNPVKEHRIKRTMRRHYLLFDFLLKAVNSHHVWSQQEESAMIINKNLGLKRWYE